MRQRSVAIVHKFIPDYRVPFYSELLSRCAAADIDLSIIYGDGDRADRTKGYLQFPAFGRMIPNRLLQLGGVQLVWQAAFEAVREEGRHLAARARPQKGRLAHAGCWM